MLLLLWLNLLLLLLNRRQDSLLRWSLLFSIACRCKLAILLSQKVSIVLLVFLSFTLDLRERWRIVSITVLTECIVCMYFSSSSSAIIVVIVLTLSCFVRGRLLLWYLINFKWRYDSSVLLLHFNFHSWRRRNKKIN